MTILKYGDNIKKSHNVGYCFDIFWKILCSTTLMLSVIAKAKLIQNLWWGTFSRHSLQVISCQKTVGLTHKNFQLKKIYLHVLHKHFSTFHQNFKFRTCSNSGLKAWIKECVENLFTNENFVDKFYLFDKLPWYIC